MVCCCCSVHGALFPFIFHVLSSHVLLTFCCSEYSWPFAVLCIPGPLALLSWEFLVFCCPWCSWCFVVSSILILSCLRYSWPFFALSQAFLAHYGLWYSQLCGVPGIHGPLLSSSRFSWLTAPPRYFRPFAVLCSHGQLLSCPIYSWPFAAPGIPRPLLSLVFTALCCPVPGIHGLFLSCPRCSQPFAAPGIHRPLLS